MAVCKGFGTFEVFFQASDFTILPSFTVAFKIPQCAPVMTSPSLTRAVFALSANAKFGIALAAPSAALAFKKLRLFIFSPLIDINVF